MRHEQQNPDALLDEAIEAVKKDRLDASTVEATARRVWTRLEAEGATPRMESSGASRETRSAIRDCSDQQALIPAYLRGELSEARTLLLEDHLRECVPCRRELRLLRGGNQASPAAKAVPRSSISWKAVAGMAVAACLLLAVTLQQTGFLDEYLPAPEGPRAVVEAINGTLFRVSAEGTVPLKSGDAIADSEELRTAKGSDAVIKLRDGSRVEIDERSQLFVSENRSSKKISLVRGNIIVEAAPQRDGHLYVSTSDCLVTVKGTVFSVSHGTKGSRVAVIEGTVVVEHGRQTESITPGQQVSTSSALTAVAVEKEIAWSRNADEHVAMMRQLTALQKDLEVAFRPGVRGPSQLLELVPANTLVYLSLPNLTSSLGEAERLFQERLEQSPELRAWWDQGGSAVQPRLEEALARIQAFGNLLGDEVVVAVAGDEQGRPKQPIILAEVANESQFQSTLQSEVAHINAEVGHQVVQIVTDPFAQAPNDGRDSLYVFEENGILAASPSLELLQEFAQARQAGASGFIDTPLYSRLSQAYEEGVGYLVSVDLGRIIDSETRAQAKNGGASKDREMFRRLGVLDVQNLMVERKPSGDDLETRAVVSFGSARRGVASWLAEPGPMGSLQFVSADAKAAGAFVVKDPVLMVQDLFSILQSTDSKAWQELVDFQIQRGINIEQDFAAPLGGEVAFALDGPVLPTPSWKLVLEVYDPSKLQHTIEWAVTEINQMAAQDGRAGFELLVQPLGGRTFYSLVSRDNAVEIDYVFVDGYLIAGPNRTLLQNAIEYSQTGYTLSSSPDFVARLPKNGRAYFSALVYQDLGSLIKPLAEQAAAANQQLSPETRANIQEMAGQLKSSLMYAYAEPNQITLATTGDSFPGFNLGSALGLGSLMHMHEGDAGRDGRR